MKANPKMKADVKADAAAPKAKSKKMLVVIIAAVLLLVAGGGGAWFFLHGSADEAHEPAKKKEKKAAKNEPPEYVPLEAFTVNLQPETGDQYLQVQLTLQVANAAQVELFKANMAKVRSRVLLLLSGKKASEINTVEGKQKLAAEITAAMKQPFFDKGDEQEVSEVLFTSFIIQ